MWKRVIKLARDYNMKKILLILLCLLLLIPSYSWAANCGGSPTIYYVDFGAANDTADGLATSTPWKHVPGDVGGSWHDSNCTLQAGDKVIFKGAVAYNSSFEVTSGSGDATANRVIYDGDSGTYATRWASGTDKAIIHGQDTREVSYTHLRAHETVLDLVCRLLL